MSSELSDKGQADDNLGPRGPRPTVTCDLAWEATGVLRGKTGLEGGSREVTKGPPVILQSRDGAPREVWPDDRLAKRDPMGEVKQTEP